MPIPGGLAFSRGALFYLLRNPVYRSVITHGTINYPGAHPAIGDAGPFDAVGAGLTSATRRNPTAQAARVAAAPLKGRLFDSDGEPMTPTFSHGARGQVYRYYVSAPLQQGARRTAGDDRIRRVPAVALEVRLAAMMAPLLPADVDSLARIVRVEIYPGQLHVLLPATLLAGIRSRLPAGTTLELDADPQFLRLTASLQFRLRGSRSVIVGGSDDLARLNPVLIRALRAAHDLVEHDRDGMPFVREVPTAAYQRRLIRLAFLAPDLQAAILAGSQLAELTLEALIDTPPALLWRTQRAGFGR